MLRFGLWTQCYRDQITISKDIKGVFGVDTQHSAPGKPAVPKGKADKVGAFSGNRGEFLLFSWPLCRSLKLQRNPLKHIETWFRPLGALGI